MSVSNQGCHTRRDFLIKNLCSSLTGERRNTNKKSFHPLCRDCVQNRGPLCFCMAFPILSPTLWHNRRTAPPTMCHTSTRRRGDGNSASSRVKLFQAGRRSRFLGVRKGSAPCAPPGCYKHPHLQPEQSSRQGVQKNNAEVIK